MYIAAERNPEVNGDIGKNILNQLSVLNDNDLFIMNNEYFTDAEKEQLNITAWKDLNKYKDVSITFLGANFENSLIYKGNKELFESSKLEGLLTRKTALKDRLRVYYFSKNHKLSKTWKTNNPDKVKKEYTISSMPDLAGKTSTGRRTKATLRASRTAQRSARMPEDLTSTNTL
ncbi:hypothetical protein LNP17_26270 [Klebsiella variicola subsp. variicola]|nr:hypothetical protein [Klebsiella variicola subsp. variicola]